MKTPKNLEKSLNKKKTSLSQIVDFDYSYSDDNRAWDDIQKDQKVQLFDTLQTLAGSISEEVNDGYVHASNFYDANRNRERVVYRFLGKSSPTASSDDDASDMLDSDLMLDEIRDKFKENVLRELPQLKLQSLTGFSEAYTLALNLGYTGTESDFERDLKNDSNFYSFVQTSVSRYTG